LGQKIDWFLWKRSQ